MKTTESAKLAVFIGCLLLTITFLKALTLQRGGGVLIGLGFLLLAALTLFFLSRECGKWNTPMRIFPLIALALLIRILLLEHATLDYEDFLHKWVEHFRQFGGFAALKDAVGNYNVPYLYCLALLSYLPVPDLYGIKLLSILFDLLLAWGGLRLAKCLSENPKAHLLAFTALLFLPTVILNGSVWGQCDSIWGALCVHALASALSEKPKTSLALLALAFSFKLQAIFFVPLWCALWFTGHVKLRHFPIFPSVFFLTMVPALLVGKPAGDILAIYLDQAGSSAAKQTLNYNSPSVFAFLPYQKTLGPWASKTAILCAFLFVLALLTFLYVRRKQVDNTVLTLAGAALGLGVPYLLPFMHERYFFLGGVLLVILACVSPRLTVPSVGAEFASLGGYHAYLLGRYAVVFHCFGLTFTQAAEGALMLLAISGIIHGLQQSLRSQQTVTGSRYSPQG